jgi:hypothetical protein
MALQLFMVLLGCRPAGRNTEQHDIFFGIAHELKDLIQHMNSSWPEAKNKIHIDAWRSVQCVDGYKVAITEREMLRAETSSPKLFFINLGGYKENEFEEFHYKMVVAANDKSLAIQQSRKTAFFKHTGFPGATAHVDDKYGIDVDDIMEITDILSARMKSKYSIELIPAENIEADKIHLGYLKMDKLANL